MSGKEIRIGKKNALFQHLEVIKTNRSKRASFGEFFVEGVRNINLAVKYGWKIKSWIYADFNKLSDWAKEKIKTVKTECNYCLEASLMDELSGKTDKSELLAIVEMKSEKVEVGKCPFVILFDRPSKKGNLGTIIRSADALGCDGIVVAGHGVDIFDPEVIGSSMGSFFATKIEKMETNEQVVGWIEGLRKTYKDLQVVATDEKAKVGLREFDFKKPTILLVGNEGAGLSQFFLNLCDVLVKIPMVGEASSFNVACATSIFMYEVFAQRN